MYSYINSFNMAKPLVTIGLAVLQSVAVPFTYEPLILAAKKIFGFFGLLIFFIGKLLGAFICYDISKTFFPLKILKKVKNTIWFAGLLRIIPMNFNMMSYAMGMIGVSKKKFLISTSLWIAIIGMVYYLNDGYFSYRQERLVLILRGIISLTILFFLYIRSKSNRQKYK